MVPIGALVRGAAPLAKNLAGLFTDRAVSRTPAFVTWGLTSRCPLRCMHCDMGTPIAELDHEQRVALAHQLGRSKVWAISLIGGEVTIISELPEYAAILKRHGKYVSLSTSGLGLARHLDQLLDACVDSFTFSVDSHRAEVHDAFRGPQGLFESVLASIERIRTVSRKGRPGIQVRCTINRMNFRQLAPYVEFWQPKVDNIILQIIQDNGLHHVRDRSVLFREDERDELVQLLADLRKRYPFLRTKQNELMPRFVYEPDKLYKDIGFRCLLVPATSMTILPNGGVRLCYGRVDSAVGNVTESSLEELWQSALTRETQRRMQSKEFGCMCWEQACGGNLELLPVHRTIEKVLDAVHPGLRK
jgi:AdoMet-dependent heme synthase